MAHNIPPAPGPGEAPQFEKRMDELKDRLDHGKGGRQRRREAAGTTDRPAAQGCCAPSAPGAAQSQQAAARGRADGAPELAAVQPQSWEEPYVRSEEPCVRPPRKRPQRRKPEHAAGPVSLSATQVAAISAVVSALVSLGMVLALGGVDAAAASPLLAAGWSL